MMPDPVQWNGPLVINFIFLALIRGTTPLMMHLGVEALQSASLLVAIKCGITLLLFLLSMGYLITRDVQLQCNVINNLRNKNTYFKLVVIGLFQSAIPYVLAVYSLKFLPPTMLGVFMVTTPWWSILIQRLPFVGTTIRIPGMIKFGMLLGLFGILIIFGPIVRESVLCEDATVMNTTNVTMETIHAAGKHKYRGNYDSCLSGVEIMTGFLALLLAPILWGSVTVYWKFHRKDIHYLVSSIGQNFFGGIFCIFLWLIAGGPDRPYVPTFNSGGGLGSILYLGIATGWLATLLVHYLFASIGAKATNQVLTAIPFLVFIEDVSFVHDVITDKPWIVAMEIIGLLMVTGGVFITNLCNIEQSSTERRRESHEDITRSRSNSLDDPLLQNHDSDDDRDFTSSLVDDASSLGGYNPPSYGGYNPPSADVYNAPVVDDDLSISGYNPPSLGGYNPPSLGGYNHSSNDTVVEEPQSLNSFDEFHSPPSLDEFSDAPPLLHQVETNEHSDEELDTTLINQQQLSAHATNTYTDNKDDII